MKNRGPELLGKTLRRATVIPEGFLSSVKIKQTSQPVPNGTEPVVTTAPGGVLQSDVELSNTNEDVLVQLALDADEAFPTLTDISNDDEWGLAITIDKTIVDPAAAIPAITAGSVGEVERTALDRWASLQLMSKISLDALPATRTIYGARSYDLPNILEEVGVLWEVNGSAGANAEGVIHVSDFDAGGEGENTSWSVTCSTSAGVTVVGAPYAKIRRGKNGLYKSKLVRTLEVLTADVIGDTSVLTGNAIWDAVFGEVIVTSTGGQQQFNSGFSGRGNWAAQSVGGFQQRLTVGAARYDFGPVIYTETPSLVTITPTTGLTATAFATGGSKPGGGSYPSTWAAVTASVTPTLKLPVSTTPPPASGTWLLIEWDSRPWRFGRIWVTEKLYVQIP